MGERGPGGARVGACTTGRTETARRDRAVRYHRDMVIVTGSVEGRPDTIDRILELGLTHVQRSRLEPGCILHSIHRDVENELRVVFLEQWEDAKALVFRPKDIRALMAAPALQSPAVALASGASISPASSAEHPAAPTVEAGSSIPTAPPDAQGDRGTSQPPAGHKP